jgi:hypothetical protein
MALLGFLKKGKQEGKLPLKGMPTPPSPPKTAAPQMPQQQDAESALFPDMPEMEQGLDEFPSDEELEIPDIMPKKYKEREAEILKGLEDEPSLKTQPTQQKPKAEEQIKPPKKPAPLEAKQEVPEELPELEEEIELPSPEEEEIEVITSKTAHEAQVMEGLEDIEEPEAEEMPARQPGGPIFITTDNYSIIKNNISRMKDSVRKSEDISENLNKTRTRQDALFSSLHDSLENVERKLVFADKTLFER